MYTQFLQVQKYLILFNGICINVVFICKKVALMSKTCLYITEICQKKTKLSIFDT